MSTEMDVLEDIDTDHRTSDGDHDRFSHIVVPASAVTEAYITGNPVTALCGKTWTPSRDPKKHPRCKECDDVLAEIVLKRRGY